MCGNPNEWSMSTIEFSAGRRIVNKSESFTATEWLPKSDRPESRQVN